MNTHQPDISQLITDLTGKNPRVILKRALDHFQRIAVSFSGAEDVVLIDMLHQLKKTDAVTIFTLDTGRLHPETYRFIDTVRNHYQIAIDVYYPQADTLERLVRDKGLFSFYQDGHHECCGIRKVEPLRRALRSVDAWITGQRRDQSLETRQNLNPVEIDETFSTGNHSVVKFNPLADWSSQKVWDYIEAYQVPFNELHQHGYRSIGCEPCTRPTLPNQHEREGRWWWESANKKECGIHSGNAEPDG